MCVTVKENLVKLWKRQHLNKQDAADNSKQRKLIKDTE